MLSDGGSSARRSRAHPVSSEHAMSHVGGGLAQHLESSVEAGADRLTQSSGAQP